MFRNLMAEMTRKGIGVEELARHLGLHRNTFTNKLNGTSEFTLKEIERIQKIFNECDFKYLFTREHEKSPA